MNHVQLDSAYTMIYGTIWHNMDKMKGDLVCMSYCILTDGHIAMLSFLLDLVRGTSGMLL